MILDRGLQNLESLRRADLTLNFPLTSGTQINLSTKLQQPHQIIERAYQDPIAYHESMLIYELCDPIYIQYNSMSKLRFERINRWYPWIFADFYIGTCSNHIICRFLNERFSFINAFQIKEEVEKNGEFFQILFALSVTPEASCC